MNTCLNCVYRYFCYGDRKLVNINICCSGYVREKKEIRNNKKTKEK